MNENVKLAIIGAGPAGIEAALQAKKIGISYGTSKEAISLDAAKSPEFCIYTSGVLPARYAPEAIPIDSDSRFAGR